MWRVIAGVVALLTGFILFGEASEEHAGRVVLAMGASAAGIFLLCGRRIVTALLITAFVLMIGGSRVPWLWAVAGTCGAAAFVIFGTALAKRLGRPPDIPAVGDAAPFIEVEERTFQPRSWRVVMIAAMAIPFSIGVVGLVLGEPAVWVTSSCVLFTLAFIRLLSWPAEYSVDQDGLSARLLFGRKTIRWRDVVVLQTYQRRAIPYSPHLLRRVLSAERSIAFYDSIKESDELRRIIAGATGLTWT